MATTVYKEKLSEKTILIAEDDLVSYKILSHMAGKTGVNIIWAQNGQEAVDICSKNMNIALVFMDINMPVMDGLEATCCIKKLRKELPIIIQTAYDDHETESFEAGCNEFICKPYRNEIIFNLINKYIS